MTGLKAIKEITPVLDTAIYAANDVLFVPIEIIDTGRISGGNIVLNGALALDEDNEAAFAFDLVFLRSNVSLGAINGAVAITDVDAREIIGVVKVAATDVEDLINSKLYFRHDLNVQMQLAAASKSLWVGGILRSGTPTFASASDMKLKLSFTQD